MSVAILFWIVYIIGIILTFPSKGEIWPGGAQWIIGWILFGLLGYTVYGGLVR